MKPCKNRAETVHLLPDKLKSTSSDNDLTALVWVAILLFLVLAASQADWKASDLILRKTHRFMLEKIEKQVEFMESNPEYGMCYGKIVYFEDSIKNTSEYSNSNKQGWVFDDLLKYGCFIPAPSTFMRKEVFETVGEYDENLWIEDWDMWLRISQKYQVGYIDEYLAYYRKHDTNISSQSLKMYKAEKQILEKYKDYENFDNVIKNKKIVWFSLLSRKYKKEAMKYFMHSIKYLLVNIRVLKALIKLVFFR